MFLQFWQRGTETAPIEEKVLFFLSSQSLKKEHNEIIANVIHVTVAAWLTC